MRHRRSNPHGSRALSAAADDDVDPAVARRKELRAFLESTPAKLTALGALLVLLTLTAGSWPPRR